MTDRELLEQALTELIHCRVFVTTREKIKHPEGTEQYDNLIEALRARLAQPEPEPKGNKLLGIVDLESGAPLTTEERKALIEGSMTCLLEDGAIGKLGILLHRYEETVRSAAPPQREWQGLTDETEIKHCWYEACQTDLELTSQLVVYFAHAIEAKLKEKNT